MQQLLNSIREVGIQVPLTVYPHRSRFVLIDGERRWRCARRLNLKIVPVLVQPAPGRLENILTMFNIHNVRENWDLMPMAKKLGQVREMLAKEGQGSSPKDLAGLTGMSLSTVRRALELLELPDEYQQMLLEEAEKPKEEQQITADLFVEIFKARRAVQSYVPEVFDNVTEEQFVDSLVDKYTSNVVNNVVKFRDLGRIARAELAGGDRNQVAPVIVELIRRPQYKIEDAYRETVEGDYRSRDIGTRARGLLEVLREVRSARRLPPEARAYLADLRTEIDRLLGH